MEQHEDLPRCSRDLPARDFYQCPSRSDGLHSYCPTCNTERAAEWRERPGNRERARNVVRGWRARRPGYTPPVHAERQCRVCGEVKAGAGFYSGRATCGSCVCTAKRAARAARVL